MRSMHERRDHYRKMDIEDIEEFKKSWPSYWRRYSEMARAD